MPPIFHIPVMLNEVINYLAPQKGGIYVDGTIGLGGHAEAILRHISPQGRLIGIDRDAKSLAQAKQHLMRFLDQCDFIQDDYRHTAQILQKLDISNIDGILLDLGLSSFQLNDPQRGFSFQVEGPLDMRMNQEQTLSAYELVNSLSEKDMASILNGFGEERFSQRIARGIIMSRAQKPIQTTTQLRWVILKSLPLSYQRQRIDPATRTFQALRIAVNRELEALQDFLDRCTDYLKPGGRLLIIAFHSLEDRMVKQKLKALEQEGQLKLIVKKPLQPSENEIHHNPRARSARLRIAERI